MEEDDNNSNKRIKLTNENNIIVPEELNEMYIIDELLTALIGIEGYYIKFDHLEIEDPSLKDIVSRIIPICKKYLFINEYIKKFKDQNYGLIQQAFCGFLSDVLKNHLTFVTNLENDFKQGKLTVYKLWFYSQEVLSKFTLIENILSITSKEKGGEILTIVYKEYIQSYGDQHSNELLTKLLDTITLPYFEMLELWIYKGVLYDSLKEFLIQVNQSKDLWNRFELKTIPIFLEKYSQEILLSGKYLFILRENGENVINPNFTKFQFTCQETIYEKLIRNAIQYSSSCFMKYIFSREKLFERIISLRNVFLLENGNFSSRFLETTEKELLKSIPDINLLKLNSLLQESLDDPFLENYECILLEDKTKLIGFEVFTLNYKANTMISIFINEEMIQNYQQIFKHLFYCKYIERCLLNSWNIKNSTTLTKFKMIQFHQNYMTYFIHEIINRNFDEMIKKLKTCQNPEDILKFHNQFLNLIIQELIQSNHSQIILKILSLSLSFTKFIEKDNQMYQQIIVEYDKNFDKYIKELQQESNLFSEILKDIFK